MAKGNAWLARDEQTSNRSPNYRLFPVKPSKINGVWYRGNGWCLSLDGFDARHMFPDLRLKPGDGPIPVRISIERAE